MKIFIAGAREIKSLKVPIIDRINRIIRNKYEIIVGDANGIDKVVQNFLNNKNYKNVTVFSMEDQRNNIGNWDNTKVHSELKKNTREYFTEKDKRMAEIADVGLMIWNKKSEGTLNNIINLLVLNKKVCLFIHTEEKIYLLNEISDLEKIILSETDVEIQEKYSFLLKRANKNYSKKLGKVQSNITQLML